MPEIRSRIIGTGLGIPSKVLTNDDLAKFVDTNDEWIRTRTGIRERRIIDRDKGESLTSISVQASREALKEAGLKAADIDLIICCTCTPETVMPVSAARIHGALGCENSTGCFDLNAACSGFLTGLHTADAMIRGGAHKRVLVIGAEVFTSILDWKDRTTCVLFGDGAGAAVLDRVENPKAGDSQILASQLFTLFDSEEYLAVKGGGSRSPQGSADYMVKEKPFITMNGSEVFKSGSRGMAQAAKALLEQAGLKASDVKWFVPHQANQRIIEMVAKLLDYPMERVYMNLDRWGNTSAATVATCLAEMKSRKLVKKGDLLLLDVFGGGYTYGAMLLRY